ncbi:hypothetical protein KUCAC02_026650, partial [Chaenocephalus aceratus]
EQNEDLEKEAKVSILEAGITIVNVFPSSNLLTTVTSPGFKAAENSMLSFPHGDSCLIKSVCSPFRELSDLAPLCHTPRTIHEPSLSPAIPTGLFSITAAE